MGVFIKKEGETISSGYKIAVKITKQRDNDHPYSVSNKKNNKKNSIIKKLIFWHHFHLFTRFLNHLVLLKSLGLYLIILKKIKIKSRMLNINRSLIGLICGY